MLEAGIRPLDADIFSKAAVNYRVHILVRATNPASLPYMSLPDYSAKRLDCKAKTADRNVTLNGRAYQTAGLVVDPTVVGATAYDGAKYGKALEEWDKFRGLVAQNLFDASGKRLALYFPGLTLYAVQLDPEHKHYGCVMFSSMSLATAASYVHGDYDLYAIVPADNPTETLFVKETRQGQVHARSKELLDVQNYVNSRIGRPMILHGDQEKYATHSDEVVYAFLPDGRRRMLNGKADIEAYYATELKGRKTAGKGVATEPAYGLFHRVT